MSRGHHKGFTLVELVTVLVVVSILSLMFVTQWRGLSVNLAAQADQLVSDIRYIQSLSMTRGQRYRINFSAAGYSFSNAAGTVPVPHPATAANNVSLASGITLTGTHAFLVFSGNGAPYVDSALPGTALAADAVITLSAEGENRTVRISPQTGRVIAP